MPDKNFTEKRVGERVHFETNITLQSEEKKISVTGSSRDLSMKGAFVKTDEAFSIGASCELTVKLTGSIDDVTLQMKGKIVRIEADGVGINFTSVDLDSYTHLKKLVQFNSEHPDDVV